MCPVVLDQLVEGEVSLFDMALSRAVGLRVVGGDEAVFEAGYTLKGLEDRVDEVLAIVRLHNLGEAEVTEDRVEGRGHRDSTLVQQRAKESEPGGYVSE